MFNVEFSFCGGALNEFCRNYSVKVGVKNGDSSFQLIIIKSKNQFSTMMERDFNWYSKVTQGEL